MRALIAAQLSLWHFRAANWHLHRGEAWIWRYFAAANPDMPQTVTGHRATVLPIVLATLMALLIAAPWIWIVWRSTW